MPTSSERRRRGAVLLLVACQIPLLAACQTDGFSASQRDEIAPATEAESETVTHAVETVDDAAETGDDIPPEPAMPGGSDETDPMAPTVEDEPSDDRCADCDAGAVVTDAMPSEDTPVVDASVSMPSTPIVPSDAATPGRDAMAAEAGIAPSNEDATVAEEAGPSEPPCQEGELVGPTGHCYYLSEVATDWETARQACLSRGVSWDLAAVEAASEHEWITAHLSGDTWIGASDAEVSDTWVWVATGTVFWVGDSMGESVDGAFTIWWSSAPSDTGNLEQCGRYSVRDAVWYWADLECETEFPFLCEAHGAAEP